MAILFCSTVIGRKHSGEDDRIQTDVAYDPFANWSTVRPNHLNPGAYVI